MAPEPKMNRMLCHTFKRFVSPTMTKHKGEIAGGAYKRGWMATLKCTRRGQCMIGWPRSVTSIALGEA
jgi:hypothetical protein